MPDSIYIVSMTSLFATRKTHRQGDMPCCIGLEFFIYLFSKGPYSASPAAAE